MVGKKKIPEIRFEGFCGEWEECELGELLDITSASRVHKNEWTEAGVPFFRSSDVVADYKGFKNNKAFISFKLFEELSNKFGCVQKNDLLVTGGGSIGIPYLVKTNEPLYFKDADLLWLKNNNSINGYFLYTFFSTLTFRYYVSSITHIGTISHYTVEQAKATPIKIPEKKEQTKIGTYFQHLDNLINLKQRKYEKLLKVKKAMLEKMFPKNGEDVPEIRFKGFGEKWETRELGNETEIIAGGTPNTAVLKYWEPPIIPWMSSGEINKKRLCATNNLISQEGFNNSSAKWIRKNSVLIALAGQGKTRGTVAVNTIALTTNQSIAAIIPNVNINYEFLFQNLEKRYEELRSKSSGDGSRGGLNKQIISEIQIICPAPTEQTKIGNIFKNLDNLLTLHQSQLEKLKNIKKACLEKMFV